MIRQAPSSTMVVSNNVLQYCLLASEVEKVMLALDEDVGFGWELEVEFGDASTWA